ncbi:L-aspartate oxidase [Paracoccus onubensis]|uniref:L-aspartate oxidase n=1 Tax=Paracoccus onubensis TaxID=1675788 RepID=A0A418T7R2_9RHOB|nr:L-aspartate oxidase [Paracoccus onubensis]RJE89136.1 L-aspartate oxidase [Paracoccus onubensis]
MRPAPPDLTGRVVIIGDGIAGLVAALALAPQPVVLVTQAGPGQGGSTALAQGGIAAAIEADDSPELHLADTLAAGAGLCDANIAETILRQAGEAIDFLERHGTRFDRDASGAPVLGLEAAHGRRRILHAAGDGSGGEIVRALVAALRRCASVAVLEGRVARRLLTHDGAIAGVLLQREGAGMVLPARQVVMATGGIGGLYDATTNPVGNWGQGIMLAARAGAALADMEFVQFHPTALAVGQGRLPLISEAVRGEGAILINDRGERFLAGHPGGELAPRDIVARAIHAEMTSGRRVFLKADNIDFPTRFPAITALCRSAGIDPARAPIPVRPAQHYHMGGIHTDAFGRSTLPGLWAIGECAATGLHGANRLASNSLLEAAVMGLNAARDIAASPGSYPVMPAMPDLPPEADPGQVRAITSRHLGILRDGASLHAAIAGLLPLALGGGEASDPAITALSIAVFAALRQESRGAHARTDFPAQAAHSVSRRMTLDQIIQSARLILSDDLARSA